MTKATSEQQAYYDAKRRCTNKNTKNYHNYGGRGILFKFNTFEEFLQEVGQKPKGYLLDRIDNNKHYEVGNVRWVDTKVSRLNQRKPTTARKVSKTGCLYVHWGTSLEKYYVQIPCSGSRRQKIIKYTDDFLEACCIAKSFIYNQRD